MNTYQDHSESSFEYESVLCAHSQQRKRQRIESLWMKQIKVLAHWMYGWMTNTCTCVAQTLAIVLWVLSIRLLTYKIHTTHTHIHIPDSFHTLYPCIWWSLCTLTTQRKIHSAVQTKFSMWRTIFYLEIFSSMCVYSEL